MSVSPDGLLPMSFHPSSSPSHVSVLQANSIQVAEQLYKSTILGAVTPQLSKVTANWSLFELSNPTLNHVSNRRWVELSPEVRHDDFWQDWNASSIDVKSSSRKRSRMWRRVKVDVGEKEEASFHESSERGHVLFS